jgi:hypothetical protein
MSRSTCSSTATRCLSRRYTFLQCWCRAGRDCSAESGRSRGKYLRIDGAGTAPDSLCTRPPYIRERPPAQSEHTRLGGSERPRQRCDRMIAAASSVVPEGEEAEPCEPRQQVVVDEGVRILIPASPRHEIHSCDAVMLAARLNAVQQIRRKFRGRLGHH